jgi:outer membrane receptor protein involved in Fe transport
MKSTHRSTRRHNRTLLACALASCMLLAAPQVLAQSTSATIRGQVSADSTPASGATVTATNLATGLTRSVQSTGNGSYSLNGLPPGSYRLDVTANGQTRSQNITVQIGQTATVNLGVGGVAETAPAGEATNLETVTVTAPAAIETKTSEVATYVTQKQIEALPQASRNFLAFADTVPGMIFETGSDGTSKLRGGAQNSNGINVFIDGVGQKNYVLKGGVSGQDSSSGSPFPQLAIGEYKVITSNYKAEYDQISSAAVTAVTKSGTNEFEGHFFWDYTNDGWRKPTFAEERGDFKVPSKEEQYGASFGGPIVRDNLFFFVTYEAKEIDRPRTVRLGTSNFDPADITPEILSYLGPANAPFKQDNYFGKLTWQAGDAHLVELSAKKREETEITGVGDGPNVPSYGTAKTNDSTRVDLRWQWSGMTWLNDLHLTSEDDEWSPRPITMGPGRSIRSTLANPNDGDTLLNIGGGRDYQDKGQKGESAQNDFTFTGLEGHTIKAGIKYKSVKINAFEQQPYNPQFRYDLGENIDAGRTAIADFIPWDVEFGAPLPGIGDRNISSRNKQYGIYLQDDWEVTDKLTLNLGVRYDYEETPGFEDYVTDPGLVAALRGWSNVHGPNVDYDIEDYISDGSNRKPDKNNWAPRLGFSYDLFADQRHVIFGGAGRSYDRNLFDYLALEQSKSTFPGYRYSFNTPDHPCTVGTGTCVAWDPSYYDPANLYALVAANPNLGAEVFMINNDLKTPYSDQFSLGMRNTVTVWNHDWNTSATIAHVRSYDGVNFALGNRWPDGSYRDPAFPDATWGHQPWDFGIPGYGRLLIGDNGIETKLNQLLLSIDKPYSEDSPWGVTIAYTYSDAKENRLNAANSDEHFTFDYPNLDGLPFITSVGIPKHRLVATAFGDIWGMTLSSKLTLASPNPKDSTNCYNTTSTDNCYFDSFIADETIGFKQLDIALQKTWNTGTDLNFYVRGDVFNVFNWKNYTDYDNWRGTPGAPNPNFGARNGVGTIWPPRMFKLSFGLDW